MFLKQAVRLVAAGVTLALLTTAVPAGAADVTLAAVQTQHFSMTFGPDTNPIKEYQVPCPASMKVYSGGARDLRLRATRVVPAQLRREQWWSRWDRPH